MALAGFELVVSADELDGGFHAVAAIEEPDDFLGSGAQDGLLARAEQPGVFGGGAPVLSAFHEDLVCG